MAIDEAPVAKHGRAMSSKVMALLRKLSIDTWLRAHGKSVRPELTKKQKQELKECFELIDLEGSGAIDSAELPTAFSVLGMHVRKAEVCKLMDEVDETGELEYPDFIRIMKSKLETQGHEAEEETRQALPFQLLARAYRRKKLMKAVMAGDKPAQDRLRSKSLQAENERMAVLAAMEAEKKNPTLAYDEKDLRTISDINYQNLKKAQVRHKRAGRLIPKNVVETLDEDVKQVIYGFHEETKDGEEVIEDDGQEARPISLSKQIRDSFKAELAAVNEQRNKLRHRPVLERQMIHLKATRSMQEAQHRQVRSSAHIVGAFVKQHVYTVL